MKGTGIIRGLAVLAAVAGLCLPQPLLAAVSAEQSSIVGDAALGEGGVLIGQVLNVQGLTLAKVPVALHAAGKSLAQTQTDERGYFAFRGLRGGVYQVAAVEGVSTYRLWSPGTAPPSAEQGVLVVAGQELTRGLGERLGFFLSNPIVQVAIVGGLIGGTVAGVLAATEDGGGPITVP